MLTFIFYHYHVTTYYMLKHEISSQENNTMGRTAVINIIQGLTHRVSFSFSSMVTPPLRVDELALRNIYFMSGRLMAWDMIIERVGKIKILWVDSSVKHFQMVKRYLSQRLNSP